MIHFPLVNMWQWFLHHFTALWDWEFWVQGWSPVRRFPANLSIWPCTGSVGGSEDWNPGQL